MYRNATKVFIPENNLAHEADHMKEWIQEAPDTNHVDMYYQKENGKVGICKSKGMDQAYAMVWARMLEVGRIRFSSDFFTNTRDYDIATMKSEFRAQLEGYHETLEGKLSGKGGDKQDDLLIAALQGPYVLQNIRI